MLPGEEEIVVNLRKELSEDFHIGRELVELSVDIILQRHPTVPQRDLEDAIIAYRVGNALCIKSCKSFRSSLLLAEVGASNDLTIISRTMFETFVAANFVLRDHITLGHSDVDDAALRPNDRARLYVAFGAINKFEELKRHKSDPETASVLAGIDPKPYEDVANALSTEVGENWAARFRKHPRTYSGLSLAQLSKNLGPDILGWYSKVYGEQSKATHATDFLKHAAYSSSEDRFLANWFPTVGEVRHLVGMNGLMLWGCLHLLDKQFHFDSNTEADLEASLPLLGGICGSC